jgi:hypothetical protein
MDLLRLCESHGLAYHAHKNLYESQAEEFNWASKGEILNSFGSMCRLGDPERFLVKHVTATASDTAAGLRKHAQHR